MLSRRHLLTAGGALTGLSVLDARTVQAQVQAQTGRRAAERPNLLWFISDDASPFIGAYGDTPTIDRLARQARAMHMHCPACGSRRNHPTPSFATGRRRAC